MNVALGSEQRAALIQSHTWIVDQFAARYRRLAQRVDIDSAGLLGLCEAANFFDPSKGVKFATYAWNWVKGRILEEVRLSHLVPISKRAALGKTRQPAAPPPIIERIPPEQLQGRTHRGYPQHHSVFCASRGLVTVEDPAERIDRPRELRKARARISRLSSPDQRRVAYRALAGQSLAQIAAGLEMSTLRAARLLREAQASLTIHPTR